MTKRFTLTVLAVFIITAVSLFVHTTHHIPKWRYFQRGSTVENIDGIRTYRYVCIEANPDDAIFDRKITIYNAAFDGSIDLHMRIRPERQYRHYHSRVWPLTFKKRSIPKSHSLNDIHAYFVPYSRYGNLHHFLHDSAENLYATMEMIGDYKDSQLQVPRFHILAHTWDLYAGTKGEHVNHLGPLKKTFAAIEEALGSSYNEVYTSVPPNTCYTLGVFGFDTSQLQPIAFENALRLRWDMTPDKCGSDKRPQVLLVQRRKRRISNMDQIRDAIQQQLDVKTVSVDFEDLSLKEQVQVVSCSDVLIGMHGAGIDHHRFLKPHGAVLVISFKPFPGDYYEKDIKFKQQGYDTMENCRAHVSDTLWQWYRAHVSNATEKEVFAYSEGMKHHNVRNIWFYADCKVDVQVLVQKTERLLLNMN